MLAELCRVPPARLVTAATFVTTPFAVPAMRMVTKPWR